MLRSKKVLLLSMVLVVVLVLGLGLSAYAGGDKIQDRYRDRLRDCDYSATFDCTKDRLRERDQDCDKECDCDQTRDRLRLKICKDEIIEEILVYEKYEEELKLQHNINNQELLREREVVRLRIQEMLKELKEETEQYRLRLKENLSNRFQNQIRNQLQIKIGLLEDEIEIIESIIK